MITKIACLRMKSYYPAGKYWSPGPAKDVSLSTSPGRSLKILFDRPGDVPTWHPGVVLK